MFCQNCGQEIDDSAVICPYCGVSTKQMHNNEDYEKRRNGYGIAGFAVGLAGLLGGNFLLLVPGVVALVLSIVSVVKIKKYNSFNGLAIAGLVISILSFLFWLMIWITEVIILIEEGQLILF